MAKPYRFSLDGEFFPFNAASRAASTSNGVIGLDAVGTDEQIECHPNDEAANDNHRDVLHGKSPNRVIAVISFMTSLFSYDHKSRVRSMETKVAPVIFNFPF